MSPLRGHLGKPVVSSSLGAQGEGLRAAVMMKHRGEHPPRGGATGLPAPSFLGHGPGHLQEDRPLPFL